MKTMNEMEILLHISESNFGNKEILKEEGFRFNPSIKKWVKQSDTDITSECEYKTLYLYHFINYFNKLRKEGQSQNAAFFDLWNNKVEKVWSFISYKFEYNRENLFDIIVKYEKI